jgi:tRNA threonylcarbamoyladenosine biosynthesis protein TsaB
MRPAGAGAVVGFDTATPAMTVAATRAGAPLFQRDDLPAEGERPAHARELLAAIEEAAAAAGGWERVERIAVGIGPGSFTGLRIGIATARGLAQGLGIALAPVVSLAALARGIAGAEQRAGEALLPVLDARRGQVFAALYADTGEERWPPFVATPPELAGRLAALDGAPLAAGDGSIRFRQELEAAGADVLADGHEEHRIHARHLCALAAETEASKPADVEPIYLRPPDAELWREQQRRESNRRH